VVDVLPTPPFWLEIAVILHFCMVFTSFRLGFRSAVCYPFREAFHLLVVEGFGVFVRVEKVEAVTPVEQGGTGEKSVAIADDTAEKVTAATAHQTDTPPTIFTQQADRRPSLPPVSQTSRNNPRLIFCSARK
jgi:hypothetical protein